MNNILLVLIFNFILTDSNSIQSTVRPIYSVQNNSIIVKSEFISRMNNVYCSEITPYTTVDSVYFQSLDAQDGYLVTMYRYKGWDGEAGDFQAIDIKRNSKSIFKLDNQDGWVTQPSLLCPSNNVLSYVEHLDSSTVLLYFTGYAYNSNPGFLTLIILKEGQAYMVFNKEYAVNQIEKTDGRLTINLSDRYEEYVETSAVPVNNPSKYKITWENGVLNFSTPY
jgi:hypothetical protein